MKNVLKKEEKMTKKELWNELLEHNEEDFVCEICEDIPTYMIAIRGMVKDHIKQVWLCKQCFFKGEE